MAASYHLRGPRASAVALGLAFSCTRASYLEIQLTIPQSTPQSSVDLAQQVEWLDLAASDGTPSDAGPQRIPSSPVAGGLGVASPQIILAVSAPSGSLVEVRINGLDAAGNPIGSASGSKQLGPGTSSLSLTLSTHCESARECDPSGVCEGVVACDADSQVGFGACIDENAGVPSAGAPCGPSDAGHCDGVGTCLLPYCGDGVLQPDAGEQCDWGTGNSDVLPDHCRTDCKLPHCGDGVLDPDAGEICDLGGNNGQGQGCNATCNLFGVVTTLVADGGLVPYGLAVVQDSLYIADTSPRLIRRLDLGTGVLQTMAGGNGGVGVCLDGVGAAAAFCQLHGLIPFDAGALGGVLATDQAALRLMVPNATLDAGIVTTLAGSIGDGGLPPPVGFEAGPFASALYATPYGTTQIGQVIYTNGAGLIAASSLATQQVTELAAPGLGSLKGMTSIGSVVYTSTDVSILSVDTGSAVPQVATLIASTIQQPLSPDGICTDGSSIYVCLGDQTVRQVDPVTAELSYVVRADAGFVDPANCAWDTVRRALYVSDRNGQAIRKIQ